MKKTISVLFGVIVFLTVGTVAIASRHEAEWVPPPACDPDQGSYTAVNLRQGFRVCFLENELKILPAKGGHPMRLALSSPCGSSTEGGAQAGIPVAAGDGVRYFAEGALLDAFMSPRGLVLEATVPYGSGKDGESLLAGACMTLGKPWRAEMGELPTTLFISADGSPGFELRLESAVDSAGREIDASWNIRPVKEGGWRIGLFGSEEPVSHPVKASLLLCAKKTLNDPPDNASEEEVKKARRHDGEVSDEAMLAPPNILSISPTQGPTVGGITITLSGSFSGGDGTLYFKNTPTAYISWSGSKITFSCPEGYGVNIPVYVVNPNGTSNTVTFNYDPPSISSSSPASGPESGGTLVTITGSSFGKNTGMARIGSFTGTIESWSHQQITFRAAAGTGSGLDVELQTFDSRPAASPDKFAYVPSCLIQSVAPSEGPSAGGTSVTISGEDFGTVEGSVKIGAAPAAVTGWTDTGITVTAPAGTGGKHDVSVTTSDGRPCVKPNAFSYTCNITNMTPTAATPGINVTLTGTNLGPVQGTVHVGGLNATIVSWNDTQIIFLAPSITCGWYKAVVATSWGSSCESAYPLQFGGSPSITSFSPNLGPTQGGVEVTVSGSNFCYTKGSGDVEVGPNTGTIIQWSDTEIRFLLPAGEGANLAVRVTRDDGQSVAAISTFSYSAPSISSISSEGGGFPAAGGVTITVAGSNFGSEAGGVITVAGTPVTPLSWSHTQATFTLPQGTGANIPVVVIAGGQSGSPATFSYDPPQISGIAPASFPTAGGAATLSGSNFGTVQGNLAVNGTQVTDILSWSNTEIQFLMPPGSGTVPVIVTAGGQQSNPMMVNYNEPVINSIEPSHGPTQGGTLVTLTGTDFGTAGTVTVGGNPGSIDLWTDTSVSFLTPAGQGVTRPVVLSTGGQDSNPMAFNYDPPVISSMVPLPFPTGGGASITLNGNNFGSSMPDTTVTAVISGVAQPLPVVSVDHGQIVCVSPTGEGTDNTLSVTISGQTSNSLPFSFGPPVIDSMDINHGPTEGGTLVTLTGQNFGLVPAVTLGGTNCPLNGNSHTQISFYTPQGQGTGLPVIVAVAGQTSNAVPFSYDAPVINNIEPSIGPTGGGTTVFLTGINFGASGTIMFNGSPVASQTWTNTLVSFLTPSGEGISLPVFVTVGGQTSNVVSFSYSPPVINAINPAGGRTEGGYPVTLSGSSFGSSGTLSVGGNIVAPSSWTHNSVEFAMPPGQGTNIPIYLTVSGAQSNTVHFSYSPPSITGVVPSLGPTIGGTPLTISGDNFGMSGAVTVGGIPCSVQSWSHTQVTALSPEGQGAGLPVIVAVAGQHSNSTPFSYLPPVISTIVPSEGPEAGGNLIALTGTDFGTTGSVTINGNPGTVQSWSHTEITFLAPAGSGQNLSVRVMSGGQLSNSVFYSYYGAPVLTLIDPSTGGTAGGYTVTLAGDNLGTGGTLYVGGNDAAPLAWTNNWIQFTMPEGQGANVPVHVVVNGQPSNQLFFSYLPPSVISSVPTNGTAAGGTLVTVNGENFGTGGTVLVDGVPGTQQSWSHVQVTFLTPPGEGVDREVRIISGGQMSGTYGLFSYDIPRETAPGTSEPEALVWTTSDSLAWPENPDALGGYRIYRGVPADLQNLYSSEIDSCLRGESTLQEETSLSGLSESPPEDSFFWYLVVGVNASGEGEAGQGRDIDSSGDCYSF